jgi:hypothetical protein
MVVDGDGMKKKNQPKNIVDSRKLLPRVTLELVEGKDILKQEKKKMKKAKDRVRKKNLKREIKIIEKAVDSLEEHRKLLKSDR